MICAARLGFVALLASTLTGCIAAAIPVLAAGTIAGTSVRGAEKAAPPVPVATSAPSLAPNRTSVVPLEQFERRPAAAAMPLAGATTPYDAFVTYALAEARPYLPNETRHSTVLAKPGALSPETRACDNQPPAVLIDLDPEGGALDPASVTEIAVEFAPALSRLRANGLTILWLSGTDRSHGEAIRALLARALLDPTGRDVLALPAPGERKQDLRRRLGEQFCIEAIAGDRRVDFDELYDFLRDEGTAFPLEPLIGKGWFLVPPVLKKDD